MFFDEQPVNKQLWLEHLCAEQCRGSNDKAVSYRTIFIYLNHPLLLLHCAFFEFFEVDLVKVKFLEVFIKIVD